MSSAAVLRIFFGDMLIVLAFFGAVEGLLRLVAPQPVHTMLRGVYEASDQGFRYKPGTQAVCNIGYGDHEFSVNSYRARDKEYGPKRPGEWRILGVGNSYSENQALEVDEIWANVLEVDLAHEYPQRQFSVINAGQAGWGLWNYYSYLEEMLPVAQPDLVVILFGYTNDLKQTTKRHRPRPMTIRDGLPVYKSASLLSRVKRGAWYLNEMAEEYSHAYVAFRRAMFYPGLWLGITPVPRIHPIYKDPQHAEGRVEPTGEIVAGLRELCERSGARLVMLGVPNEEGCIPEEARFRIQIERPDVTTLDFKRPTRLAKAVAGRAGVPLYDPGPDLAAADERVYFLRFKHWNAQGNRIVARGLRRFLEEHDLLGGSPEENPR